MALANFTLPFGGGIVASNWATVSPIQHHHATAVNNLLYNPEAHQNANDLPDDPHHPYYKNDPYAPPTPNRQYRSRNNYLPPPPPVPLSQSPSPLPPQQFNTPRPFPQTQAPRPTYNNDIGLPQQPQQQIPPQDIQPPDSPVLYDFNAQRINYEPTVTAASLPQISRENTGSTVGIGDAGAGDGGIYPEQRPVYTQVKAGVGSKTQVHAVLDYDNDNDEYYEGDEENTSGKPGNKATLMPTVTPIQGPIFVKNGSVPVVPLFSYPTINNGTFIQIPIWWTALSVALGLEIRGEIIKGTPCVKRFNQLFCPTAGNSYPIDRIEDFIDENKALMRRMYGDFQMSTEYGPPLKNSNKRKRDADSQFDQPPPDFYGSLDDLPRPGTSSSGESYFSKWRSTRQTKNSSSSSRSSSQSIPGPARPNVGPNPSTEPQSGRIDACESKIEIVTPYWASNSAGKIRAIVNTQHFEQAIHQEVCTKMQTSRCGGDCGCEQKYKWHRLLAYDPDNDCKGIFMDWFLFPSCCVCRCNPN